MYLFYSFFLSFSGCSSPVWLIKKAIKWGLLSSAKLWFVLIHPLFWASSFIGVLRSALFSLKSLSSSSFLLFPPSPKLPLFLTCKTTWESLCSVWILAQNHHSHQWCVKHVGVVRFYKYVLSLFNSKSKTLFWLINWVHLLVYLVCVNCVPFKVLDKKW